MKRSSTGWNEKTIEQHLSELPKVADRQSKEEIYEKIQLKMQENGEKKRSNITWLMPTIASVAVVILLMLFIPPFLSDQQLSLEKDSPIEESYTMKIADVSDNSIEMTNSSLGNSYVGATQRHDEQQYEDDLVTIAVTTIDERAVPVTILVEGDSLSERILLAKDTFHNGEVWGIGNFPSIPINSIKELEDGTVQIDLPVDHYLEGLSSTQTITYGIALEETFFALGYDKIKFTTEEKAGVLFGQNGDIYEVDLKKPSLGYYVYTSSTGHKFLIRGRSIQGLLESHHSETYSLEETLELMKQVGENVGYEPSIPEGIEVVAVKEEQNLVTVVLNDYYIESEEEATAMVEAILFTAKDFGYQFVKFDAIGNQQIGPYNMAEKIEVPKFINFLY